MTGDARRASNPAEIARCRRAGLPDGNRDPRGRASGHPARLGVKCAPAQTPRTTVSAAPAKRDQSPVHGAGSVETAPLAQQQTGQQKGERAADDRDALPRVRRGLHGRSGARREQHLGDGWVAKSRLGASLIGHLDLDRMRAVIEALVGHGALRLAGCRFPGCRDTGRSWRRPRGRAMPETTRSGLSAATSIFCRYR